MVAVRPCRFVAGWLVSCGLSVVVLVFGCFWLVVWVGCWFLWFGCLGFVLVVWAVGWLWVLLRVGGSAVVLSSCHTFASDLLAFALHAFCHHSLSRRILHLRQRRHSHPLCRELQYTIQNLRRSLGGLQTLGRCGSGSRDAPSVRATCNGPSGAKNSGCVHNRQRHWRHMAAHGKPARGP